MSGAGGVSAGGPRLAGAARSGWSEPVRQIMDAALQRVGGMVAGVVDDDAAGAVDHGAGNPLPTLTLIAHHEPLFAPFVSWASALALEGPLSARNAELVALRAIFLCGSLFEWQEHEAYGLAAGMSPEEVAAVAAGPDHPRWGPLDRALLRAADELHAGATVSEATWAELARALSPAELVGVTLVAGQYRMLSGLANAAGVDRSLRGDLPHGSPTPSAGPVADDPLGLRGAVALVTGGARSIGRASALALGAAGCAVAVVDVADATGTAAAVEAAGGQAFTVAADARDPVAMGRAVDAVVERFGRLDVAVNTVGSTAGPRPLLDLDVAGFDAVVAQNLTTAFVCTKAEALAMIRLGTPGRIVNVASVSGMVGAPNAAGYGAANAGVVHLTGTAALELARYGIRVNCIVPGTHVTEAVAQAAAADPAIDEWVRRTGEATPLGRLGQLEEAAGVVLFLASRLSGYVTGQGIVEDGGMAITTARPPMGLDREAEAVLAIRPGG